MVFALCAPLSFSVRLAAEISGMMSASGQRPRRGLPGAAEATEAKWGRGAGVPQSHSVSADLAGGSISCTPGSFLPWEFLRPAWTEGHFDFKMAQLWKVGSSSCRHDGPPSSARAQSEYKA